MFEWLEREIDQIKTPKFHIVNSACSLKLDRAIGEISLPFSYKEFVLKFGDAKLYRNSWDGYSIRVFSMPEEMTLNNGERVFCIGFHDSASVYIKRDMNASLMPIFEFESAEEKVADDFEVWLRESCDISRSRYKKNWNSILLGPKPFTWEEQKIVETRRNIKWRILGIDDQKNHIFEVKNLGDRYLPYLTVGLRSKDRQLNGAVRLDVYNIGPGQTGILYVDCYKNLVSPGEIQAFELPDPRPEDRDFYYEFKTRLKWN